MTGRIIEEQEMARFYIHHNTNGQADQYFIADRKTHTVLFEIPKRLGRWLYRREK